MKLFGDRSISLSVIDLTRYELGNIILRGRLQAGAEQAMAIVDLLAQLCPVIAPSATDLRHAARLAETHRLTLYDATYAAVARARGAELATLDRALLKAGLGRRPSEIVGMVRQGGGSRRTRWLATASAWRRYAPLSTPGPPAGQWRSAPACWL